MDRFDGWIYEYVNFGQWAEACSAVITGQNGWVRVEDFVYLRGRDLVD